MTHQLPVSARLWHSVDVGDMRLEYRLATRSVKTSVVPCFSSRRPARASSPGRSAGRRAGNSRPGARLRRCRPENAGKDNGMKVLVIGATGRTAGRVVAELRQRGAAVRALVLRAVLGREPRTLQQYIPELARRSSATGPRSV